MSWIDDFFSANLHVHQFPFAQQLTKSGIWLKLNVIKVYSYIIPDVWQYLEPHSFLIVWICFDFLAMIELAMIELGKLKKQIWARRQIFV